MAAPRLMRGWRAPPRPRGWGVCRGVFRAAGWTRRVVVVPCRPWLFGAGTLCWATWCMGRECVPLWVCVWPPRWKESCVNLRWPAVELGPLGFPPRALVRRWLLRRGLLTCAPPCGGLVSASRPRAVSRSGGLRPAGNERCWILVAFVACTPWPRILMNSPG